MAIYTASKPTYDGKGQIEMLVDTDSEELRVEGSDGQYLAMHLSTFVWLAYQIELANSLEDDINGDLGDGRNYEQER